MRGGTARAMLTALLLSGFALLVPVVAAGQAEPPEDPAAGADTLLGEVPDVSPGGAFLRSLVVPGWGHAVTGAHFRGAFYVAAQSGTAWMLTKSMSRRGEARRFRAAELAAVRERLRASGVVRADSLQILAEQDPRVEEWDELLEARGQQVEDWAALGIFLLLMGAADAYVAGHLMDRPEPLSMDVVPTLDGGWELSVSVRAGRRPRDP